ncbi:MAG: SUMF1/EgtB/PvdO family nonheme iron enzyme [Parvibaculaceae bacterium]
MIAKDKPATLLILATVLGLPLAAGAVHGMAGHWQSDPVITEPVTVPVAAGSFTYRLSGEFRRGNAIVDAPLRTVTFEQPLTIMKYQVSQGEYQRCVAEGACAPALGNSSNSDLPVTGVSFDDASSYARWLSLRTGAQWRLPSDEEWAFAAGNRYADDALGLAGTEDPSKRWLASYRREADRESEADRKAKPQGFFGENDKGVGDAAGNVWEWTTSCFSRSRITSDGTARVGETDNCGVRIAEGAHRAYVVSFLKDARGSGCSSGKPPANLGLRLVRERDRQMSLRSLWRRWMG